MTGQRFGKLTVIKQVEDYISPKGEKRSQWLCECDCEEKNRIITTGNFLKRKHTQSCGCLQKEKASKIGKETKKYNTYNLSGGFGIGYTLKGEEFYFDLEDFDKIKDYCWRIDSNGYVITSDFFDNYKTLKFHRLVMGMPNDEFDIDHKHGVNTRNDNRKEENLRIVTRTQNAMNSGLQSNNTSGVTGVSWCSTYDKWIARITVNKKRIYLGSFDNFEDAVMIRKRAEEKYFGEFSYDNSMGKGDTNVHLS